MYKVGDVVLVEYPFSEIKESKKRPAIILDVIIRQEYTICQITHIDRKLKNNGHWVEKDTDQGKKMGILTDSFINLDNVIDIKAYQIYCKIGECPLIDTILDELKLT